MDNADKALVSLLNSMLNVPFLDEHTRVKATELLKRVDKGAIPATEKTFDEIFGKRSR